MPTLDDVYRKFGEAAEAAQLLETELGTMLLIECATEANLIAVPNPVLATELYNTINRHTLGQLLNRLHKSTQTLDELAALLSNALRERNRLSHSFYRHHNFRRNSEEGRIIMLQDLEALHGTLLSAYKAVMLLSGVDLDALAAAGEHNGPIRRVPI